MISTMETGYRRRVATSSHLENKMATDDVHEIRWRLVGSWALVCTLWHYLSALGQHLVIVCDLVHYYLGDLGQCWVLVCTVGRLCAFVGDLVRCWARLGTSCRSDYIVGELAATKIHCWAQEVPTTMRRLCLIETGAYDLHLYFRSCLTYNDNLKCDCHLHNGINIEESVG